MTISVMDFSNIDPRNTLYKRLMLDPSADTEVIQHVYRRLARRHHPDVDPDPEAQRRMAELNEAYAVLRDPVLRCQYDAALAAHAERTRLPTAPSPTSTSPRNGHAAPQANGPKSTNGNGGWSANGHAAGNTQFGYRYGEAGLPDGPPLGSVVDFGRYRGWTLGQIRRRDPDFLEWLIKMPIGRPYREEIAHLLRHPA